MIKIKRGPKPQFFVCASIINNNLITKTIEAESREVAIDIFNKQYFHIPKDVLGPFFKKRIKVVEPKKILKFSNQNKKAIYDGWNVNAILLIEPIDHVYLIFINRVDNKKIPKPQGTIIVPISQLIGL